jgi:hypothetical protein
MKRLAGALIGFAAVVGLAFYGKASAHDAVRARLIELCSGDAECQTAVRTHYDACFVSASKTGRLHEARTRDATLVACVNRQSGEEYFSLDETQKRP